MDLSLSSHETQKQIKKYLFNLQTNRNDGLLLQIHNRDGKNKRFRFIQANFNDNGTVLALTDHCGNIFVIDLEQDKYWKLPVSTGIPVTVSFSMFTKSDLLVSKDTAEILIFNIDTGNLTGILSGHTVPAKDISYSNNGRFCLTSSNKESIIWDLQSNSQAHRFSMKIDTSMKKVLFMPISNHILACFEDDTMYIWKFGSFECVKQIVLEAWKTHLLKSIAFTKNGRVMIIGGHTPSLLLFCLDTWTVRKKIDLPDNISGVKHLEFVPEAFDGGANKIIALLTNSSGLYFLDIESSVFLSSMHRLNGVTEKFCVSPTGKYLATLLVSGEANLYAVRKVLKENDSPSAIIVETDNADFQSSSEAVVDNKYSRSRMNRTAKSRTALNSIQEELRETLDLNKIQPLLKEFGEYPEAYRVLIWKTILQLPMNQNVYASLTSKECHPSYKKLELEYPLDNKSLLNTLKRILSNLAYWCPLFGEVDYLPELVFPFVKFFHFDPFSCFEAVATIILNWCQHWFEYYPFPPMNILSMVENVLAHHDPDLLAFYFAQKLTSKVYSWPLLSTAMSEVLSKGEWLKLWDHVLSNESSFFIMAVVSYNITCRNAIMSCKDKSDFEFFFHNQNPVDMKKLISNSYLFLKNTPEDIHPRQYLQPFRALTRGTYTVYNQYPKFILDERARQLQEIHHEEEVILREERKALILKRELEQKIQSGVGTEEQEEKLRKLEKTYRDIVDKEEERVAAQRRKLHTLRHELRLKELEVLETTRDKALKQRTQRRELELERLIEDISRRKAREDAELSVAEEEIKKYYSELLTHKNQLEIELGVTDDEMNTTSEVLRLQQEKLKTDLFNLQNETASLHQSKRIRIANRIAAVSNLLQHAETELAREVAERKLNIYSEENQEKIKLLESETKRLEKEVENLLNDFSRSHLEEAVAKEKVVEDSREQRRNEYRTYKGTVQESFGEEVAYQRLSHVSPQSGSTSHCTCSKCHKSPQKSSRQYTDEAVKSSMTERERLIQTAKRNYASPFTFHHCR